MKRSDYLRQRRSRGKEPSRRRKYLLRFVGLLLGLAVLYQLPPVKERLSWRIYDLRTSIQYYFEKRSIASDGIDEGKQLELIVRATTAAMTQAAFSEAGQSAVLTPNPTGVEKAKNTPTPGPTLPPLPESVFLEGVTWITQLGRWNYCGPVNLTMALKYWGWKGNPDDVARVIKPGVNDDSLNFIDRGKPDKNVMPYEMASFVEEETDFNVITRNGGSNNLIKHLVSKGFPVIVEKGHIGPDSAGNVGWYGHYLFVTGYDDLENTFIVQDTYPDPDRNGENLPVKYETFQEEWRAFNYIFMVIYPAERENEIYEILGPWGDNEWSNRHALEMAKAEADSLTGMDQFFAWFNVGTSHVDLLEYADAAFAYDYALFVLYPGIHEDDMKRPYRMLWYQTGPYWAYYYSGRYQDVIDRANHTLYNTHSTTPTFEESFYWRGLAYNALGQTDKAIEDFRQSVYLNPNFIPGWDMLALLGIE